MRARGKHRIRRAAALLVLAASMPLGLWSCSKPLPEEGSPQAVLYAARCNGCHKVYQPHSLTPSMWKFQVDRMNEKYRASGMRPPSDEERAQILDYLVRNSGG